MKLLRFAIPFFLAAVISGQTSSDEHFLCDQDFSKSLTAQLAVEGRSVNEPHKKIKIFIRLADFSWPIDEPAARSYFTEAYKAAVDNHREKGFESRAVSDDPKAVKVQVPDHRFEVIKAIAKRDAAWARRLTDEVMEEYDKSAKDRKTGDRSREIQELLSFAGLAVESDPALAMYLYRRVMQYPLDYHWLYALYAAAGKDRSFADALYREMVSNYRTATPRRMLFLSAYPFSRSQIFGVAKLQYGTSIPDGFAPDRDLQRLFVETFLNRIIAFTENPQERTMPREDYHQPEPVHMASSLAELEPIIIQDLPFLLQRFGEARARVSSLLTEEMQQAVQAGEKRNATAAGGFDAVLKRAEEAEEKGTLTDSIVLNLVTSSKTEEHFRITESWLGKIKEEPIRTSISNYFWFLRAELAIKEERFADAEAFSKKVPEVEHRSKLAFLLAEKQLENVNDRASAYQTLNEVAKLARSTESSVTKAKILLGLAHQYERFNHGFALEELGEAVRVINRMTDPDLFMQSEFRQISGKNFQFYTVYPVPGYDLEVTFREISKNDFELGLSNARAIDDKFLRTIAMLTVAANCAEKVKKLAADADQN
jgi:hypothetical protein